MGICLHLVRAFCPHPIAAHHSSACIWCVHFVLIQVLLTIHLLLSVQLCRAWQSSTQLCPCCRAHTVRLHHQPPWARRWPMLPTGLLGSDNRYMGASALLWNSTSASLVLDPLTSDTSPVPLARCFDRLLEHMSSRYQHCRNSSTFEL